MFAVASSMAMAAGPKFKVAAPEIIDLPSAKAGQRYELNLPDLLAETGQGTLTWSLTAAPSWLEIAGQKLVGTPANGDAGVVAFKLSVRDENNQGEAARSAQMKVLAPPVWDVDRLDLGIQNEGRFFTYDLKSKVVDFAGEPIRFEATRLPPWLVLNGSTGILSGTPQREHVGNYSGIQITAKSAGGDATIEAYGQVLATARPPRWIQSEFNLENAKSGTPYSRRLTDFVLNTENVPLKYEIVAESPPTWLRIGDTSGVLFGTPQAANVGRTTVTVRLVGTLNGIQYDSVATFRITVDPTNRPPRWRVDPLTLPKALTGRAYRQELLSAVEDPDGTTGLTFSVKKFNGPGTDWARFGPGQGTFGGTPGASNVGDNSWVLVVTDPGGLSAEATIRVKVDRSNQPPVWDSSPIFLTDAFQGRPYDVDLVNHVRDPDFDALEFTLLDASNWFTVTSTGKLFGTPGPNDVGIHTFRVRASDNVSGSAVAEFRLLVQRVNTKPEWVLDPVLYTVRPNEPIDLMVGGYARDPDLGDQLRFTGFGLPAWLKVTENGQLVGMATVADAGERRFRVRATDKEGAWAETNVYLTVQKVNQKPAWTSESVRLKNGREGEDYTADLRDFATDPDGDALSFVKLTGPEWLRVNSDGRLSGRPLRRDVGLNTFEIRALDPSSESATARIQIFVEQQNRPPRWRQDPIVLPDAPEDSPFRFDLTPYAVDDDGDALIFRIVEGPAWAGILEAAIAGTPTVNAPGPYTLRLEVSDGKASALATATGNVVKRNHAPVIAPNAPETRVRERNMVRVNLNDPVYVVDPDGDPLNFTALDNADWVKLESNGQLTLTPRFAQVGTQSVRFRVDDGRAAATGTLRVVVVRNPRPPTWLEEPIRVEARVGVALSTNVATLVRDLDGIPLTFKKKDGAAWVTITEDGSLRGTPTSSQVGTQTVIIQACNDVACADARVFVSVRATLLVASFPFEERAPGALSLIVDPAVAEAGDTFARVAEERGVRVLRQAAPPSEALAAMRLASMTSDDDATASLFLTACRYGDADDASHSAIGNEATRSEAQVRTALAARIVTIGCDEDVAELAQREARRAQVVATRRFDLPEMGVEVLSVTARDLAGTRFLVPRSDWRYRANLGRVEMRWTQLPLWVVDRAVAVDVLLAP
jgi:hypothetical protein